MQYSAIDSLLATGSEAPHDRYLLRERSEICVQLKGLSHQPEIVTANFGSGGLLLTSVLDVNRDRDLVVLDYGQDEVLTRKAIGAGQLHCKAYLDGVPVRFTCEQLQNARYQSSPAIAASIPQQMHRIQRRETFRVETPRVNGPLCIVTDPVSGKSHLLSVCDISAGGIGMLQRQGAPGLTIAQRYPNSCLAMPVLGEIEVAITVRYRMEFTSPKGERCVRYGASFEDVLPGVSDQVLRYIYFLQTNFPR